VLQVGSRLPTHRGDTISSRVLLSEFWVPHGAYITVRSLWHACEEDVMIDGEPDELSSHAHLYR
jgi:hypothetical protein